MRTSRACSVLIPVLLASAVGCAAGGGSGGSGNDAGAPPGGPPFTFHVDPSVAPNAATIAGKGGAPLAVAAVVDAAGVRSDFVADELLLRSQDQQEIGDLVARYRATIVADDRVPDAPGRPGSGAPATMVRVRLNGHEIDTGAFAADAAAIGLGGEHAFSSADAAKLAATFAHEAAAGHAVSLDFVTTSHALVHASKESGVIGEPDAFGWSEYTGAFPGNTSGATVVGAWQLLEGIGYTPGSVPVAILDGGFWLDDQGHPESTSVGTDLPHDIDQYDFVDGDTTAGGPNPNHCSGGSTCPWHGNGTAGVATGHLYDGAAAAGTGGQVARPILLRIGGTVFDELSAVKTAAAWGAKVANESFGGDCDDFCQFGDSFIDYVGIYHDAAKAGLVVVASAGNDDADVNQQNVRPCTIDSVICVGALASDDLSTKQFGEGRNYDTRAGFSNYGASVAFFSPAYVRVMPDPDTPAGALAGHNGTSCAAPYVSGVVAMMAAVDASLTPDQARSFLTGTAHTTSPDPKVPLFLDAHAAVLAANGGGVAKDAYEPNDTPAEATALTRGDTYDMTFTTSHDLDYLHFTLSDFGDAGFAFENMHEGLGQVHFSILPEDGQADPDLVTQGPTALGYGYQSLMLAPGSYRVLLSGGPQPYRFSFGAAETGLQPDAYEPDETFQTSAWVSAGVHPVNLHVTTDVDWYEFYVSGVDSDSKWYTFTVQGLDAGLHFEIVDVNQNVVSHCDGTLCTATFDASKNSTLYWAHVWGDARTRYTIYSGVQAAPSSFHVKLVNPVWWLDPTDPLAQRELVDVEDWLALTRAPNDAGKVASTLVLQGAGVHVDVLGTDGTLLAGGIASADAAHPGETADLSQVAVGGVALVHVTRTEQLAQPVDGSRLVLPRTAYQIGAQ